jgi:membrane associated rhomboid family serine protease
MGIYNRDYYRESRSASGDWGLDGLTPVVKWLLLANVVVFLLQIFIVREVRTSPLEMMRKFNPDLDRILAEKEKESPEAFEKFKKDNPTYFKELDPGKLESLLMPPERVSIIQDWFELDTAKVVYGGQVWRLLTCAFCHERYALWHILLNMLCLYWFAGTLETMYGGREFLLFYLTAAVVASLAFVALDLYTGSRVPAIGASGAVMAVMMLYTWHFPRETIMFFWFIPIEMRVVMVFYLLVDLHPVLLALAGDRAFTGVAHAAHLGGLAFGFLYGHYQWRLEPLAERLARWRPRRRPRLRLVAMPDLPPEPEADMERVDMLLQKICDTGRSSLTAEELAVLQRASQRLKQRPGGGD